MNIESAAELLSKYYSSQTVLAMRSDLNDYLRHIGKNSLKSASRESARAYFDSIKRQYEGHIISQSTFQRRKSVLNSVYKLFLEEKIVTDNPFSPLIGSVKYKVKVQSRKKKRPVSVKQVERALQFIKDPRIALIERFIARTGVRISEALGIHKKDIRVKDDQEIEISIRGKFKKERKVSVKKGFIEEIIKAFDTENCQYLFHDKAGKPINYKKVYRHTVLAFYKAFGYEVSSMRDIELTNDERKNALHMRKRITPHKLRHFYATEQSGRGMNPKKLADQLGHTSTATTLDFYYDETATVEEADLNI